MNRNESDDAVYGRIDDDQKPAANPNNVIAKVTPDAQVNDTPRFFSSDPVTTTKKVSHRSKSLPPAKRDSNNDPSQENIPETVEDKSWESPPDDNVLYNFVTTRMLEEDRDDDNVWLVTKTRIGKKNNRKNRKKKERICIKNHHILDGKVTKTMLKKYLQLLDSDAFTDGNDFIEFMAQVKERSGKDLYQVDPDCPEEF